MKNFDTRVYSIGDFLEWYDSDLLELSPDFQRRGVWTRQAKSYLIDTIVSGKPIPKVLMTQNLKGSRNKRIIIDGQQRLRSILEFLNDDFYISKSHNKEYGGLFYSKLPIDIRTDILKYEIGVDLLFDLSYEETLDIFARLNTYSVKLNPQELRNARFLGPFKQVSYRMGYSYVNYWLESGVLTKLKVARMGEAELSSDLLVVSVDNIQSSKQIPKYYKEYDSDDISLDKEESRMRKVLDLIVSLYPSNDLKATNFKRIQLFYSLYCAFYHSLYGLDNVNAPRAKRLESNLSKVRILLDNFSALYDEEDDSLEEFIDASRRATTDQNKRIRRAEILCEVIGGG